MKADLQIKAQLGQDFCVVCGGTRYRHFLISNGRAIIRCMDCGLLFVTPRPSEAELRDLFENEYIKDDRRIKHDFTEMRLDSLKREAQLIKKLLPNGGHLLDLGTASGAFLRQFARVPGWYVEGVEPSKFGAQAAAMATGLKVHHGFLREQDFPDATFNVVTSLDAFFFHPDPRADLAEIARILKNEGILAIEIPGLRFRLLKNSGLLCRLLYGVPARLNAGVHLFYYSRGTLGRLVQQFGFVELEAYPERSPVCGDARMKLGKALYFRITSFLYKITAGYFNLAPKEFVLYRKTEA